MSKIIALSSEDQQRWFPMGTTGIFSADGTYYYYPDPTKGTHDIILYRGLAWGGMSVAVSAERRGGAVQALLTATSDATGMWAGNGHPIRFRFVVSGFAGVTVGATVESSNAGDEAAQNQP